MILLELIFFVGVVICEFPKTNMLPGRSAIVQMFEWKWEDIANECENFLGPKKFGAVQTSPPSENLVMLKQYGRRTWRERYEVASYIIGTRSGNREEFIAMSKRCNNAGVRVYADVIINRVASPETKKDDTVYDFGLGTAGSQIDFRTSDYFGVPYTKKHMYSQCNDNNTHYGENPLCARDRVTLDFDQEYVQDKAAAFLNDLISIGVAGFRINEAVIIPPVFLTSVYKRLNDLSTEYGFQPGSRPYIYQETHGNKSKLADYGDVTEYVVQREIGDYFRGYRELVALRNFERLWDLADREKAVVFVATNTGFAVAPDNLMHKEHRAYTAAVAFLLSQNYGVPLILSGYQMDNYEQGPPSGEHDVIISVKLSEDDGTCEYGWACEHRLREIVRMIEFRNVVGDAPVDNWWVHGYGPNQMSYSRGNKGFIAFNEDRVDLRETLQTGLPPGEYCDVITGEVSGNNCTGTKVTVGSDGRADIIIQQKDEHMHLVIHVGEQSKIGAAPLPSIRRSGKKRGGVNLNFFQFL